MIRAIAIATLLCAGSLRAPGQSGFIVQFDEQQVGFSGYGHSVREVDDGYLIFGHQVSADPLGRTHCVLFKIDLDGAFQWRRELAGGGDHDYNWGKYDPLTTLAAGGITSVVHRFNGALPHEYVLLSLDSFGDTTDLLEINLPLVTSPYGGYYNTLQSRHIESGGIVVTGGLVEYGSGDSIPPVNRALLFELDQNGDTAWTKTYGTPGVSFTGYSVAAHPVDGYYLSGWCADGTGWNGNLLIRTDALGNELWRRRSGGKPSYVSMVRALSNGHAVTFGTYAEPGWVLPYNFDYTKYLLTEWDENGDTVWQKQSHYGYGSGPGDLELLEDASIITVGDWWGLVQLAKFSAGGDSLWTRHYEATNSEHEAYDVQIASDGGFIATGFAYQGANDPSPGVEVIWILKTDNLGCVIPGCQNVGVEEYAMDLQQHLVVSPNPASDVVYVTLDLPEGGEVQGQVQAQLLDASGRMVLEEKVQQNLNKLNTSIDVSALPAGTYYLHLRDAKRWLAGSKVVVE